MVTVSDFPETVASSKNAAQAPLPCITSTVAEGQTGWSPQLLWCFKLFQILWKK